MRLILSGLTLAFLFTLPGASAQEVQLLVQGTLVVASNKAGRTDDKLAPYEPNLKKVLRFESYRSAGDGTAQLAMPGVSSIPLGSSHRLELEGLAVDRNLVRVRVKWFRGREEVLNTTLRLNRGTPAVLGGPPAEGAGEVYAILLIVL